MERNHKILLSVVLALLTISVVIGAYFYKLYTTKTIVQQAKFELKTEAMDNEWISTGITEKNINKVEIINDKQTGVLQLRVTLDNEGVVIFEKATNNSINKTIGIFVDDTIIAAPRVNEAITDGQFVISGDFTEKDALNFKARLLGYFYTNSKEYKNLETLNSKNNNVSAIQVTDGIDEVKASHLLVCYKGAPTCNNNLTRNQALDKIRDIKKQITPQNFIDLVKKYSDEPGSNQSGGDLGWFKHGVMVDSFEKVVFPQSVGTISDIVETEFGYHLIYKQDEKRVKN